MDPKAMTCAVPSTPVCDAHTCRCEVPTHPALPPIRYCADGQRLVCTEGVCSCQTPPDLPFLGREPHVPADCTVLMVVVAAGIKKSLLACWATWAGG